MFENKLVAVLNKNVEIGVLMNALAHMSFGLGASVENKEKCRLTNYKDADDGDHSNVSEMPFIVLRANSNKIRNVRKAAIENDIQHVNFTQTMTIGTFKEQIERSAQTKEEDMEYYGIVLFGDWNKVSEITKKFSLWK